MITPEEKKWYKFIANIMNNDLRAITKQNKIGDNEFCSKVNIEDFKLLAMIYYNKKIDKKQFKVMLESLTLHYTKPE